MFSSFHISVVRKNRGFSLVEMLVVVAIISVISAISLATFFEENHTQALEKDRDLVIATLERARSLTLESSAAQQYGVHIQSDRVVLFPGATYDSSSTSNKTELLNNVVTIASSSVAGGGNDIIFERLTGKTAKTGTIQVSLKADSSKAFVITILGTGVIESN